MNVPADLMYTNEHEWIRIDEQASVDGKTIAVVGITDFAQGELGDLVYVEVETVGETISKDDIFGTVEAVKTTSDLFMPVTGTILEFNQELSESGGDNPAVINEDAYGAGWIVRIQVEDRAELDHLLSAAEYESLIKN